MFVSLYSYPKHIPQHYNTHLQAKMRRTKVTCGQIEPMSKSNFPILAKSQNHISTCWDPLCLTKWMLVAKQTKGGTFQTKAQTTLVQQASHFVTFWAPPFYEESTLFLPPNHSITFPINRGPCSRHFLSFQAKILFMQTHFSFLQNRVSSFKFQAI